MKHTLMRRTSLWCALALAFTAPMALAANTDGALVGHVAAGATVTARNPQTGFERTVTADADGNYRFPFLPVGTYTVQASQGGAAVGAPVTVYVSLGNATTADLGGSASTLDTVTVIGAGGTIIDTTSTESATNITAEELQRLPVERDALSVALLAPGLVRGEFGGVSFGGSSVAENAVYINGLNVTDFYNRVGFSSVPFSFFKEFQVKTGGYSVEFGRTTGGVINAVTKSGTNDFQYGAELVWEPDFLQDTQEDHVGRISRYDEYDRTSLNLYASGPLIKDRLFFFGMYEARDYQPRNSDDGYSNYFDGDSNSGFWGAKIDWQISDKHLLEFLAFSDDDTLTTDSFNVDDAGIRTYENTSFNETGGKDWSLAYTGYLTDTFSMKALYGENQRNANVNSLADDACTLVQDRRVSSDFIGCTANTSVISRTDERKAARLDFEWQLGEHLLRFGLDHEQNTSDYNSRYPGPGFRYEVFNVPGSGRVNGTPVPPGTTAYVRTREVRNQGTFETDNSAWYLEDNWQVTDKLMLNAGVRVEGFDNKNAAGDSYIKMDNMVAPRFGFSFDPHADGRMKIFGNVGRYFLPVANVINIKQAGPFLDRRTFYAFNGFGPDNTPILGPQIGPVDESQGNGQVADLRGEVDADMDPVYQDELILGFQQQLTDAWSWGIRGIHRKLHNAIDDMEITWNGFCEVDFFAMANPGKDLTVLSDTDCDGENDAFVNIDTSKTGWAMYDVDGNLIGITGWPKPRRSYKALEFQLDRAWDNRWAFNASYTLSYSEGNAEGPVNSDTDFSDSGRTEAFDNPWVNFSGDGYLPNDRRHQVKMRGTYAFNDNWQVGATLDARSGRPVSAFGAGNPFDATEFHSFYVCAPNCSPASPARNFTLYQRGTQGRLPWTYDLGANVTYLHSFGTADLRVKFAVYNLLNQQRVNEVNEDLELEDGLGTFNEFYGQGTGYQSRRYGQITVSVDF
ncbi:Oar protein [Lysobacter helvus]|uniref:Oar protein n=2 Tax=Lysobacteraceae TaxID=32033 RepID=A0ABN6FU37_9GAMM|nr:MULTISPECIES: TonB-dependent receptor [Lysobacter]BCT93244.1 Oar protein [Lysobacter caseinilyticus]BCT96396.1 Oar protein [Lysobacter helvus]